MRYLQLGLVFTGLQSVVQALQVVDIGSDFQIGQNSFTHRKPGSDFQETFSCAHTGKVLTFNRARTVAACCTPNQHLDGAYNTEWHCCGGGHSVAGNPAVGYRCCPDGEGYDGRVCHEPGHGRPGGAMPRPDGHGGYGAMMDNHPSAQVQFFKAGDSQGGNSQGGNSQGGNGQGGNSQGGNSQGGNSQGGNSQGGNSQGGNSQGGNSQGGNSQGGNSQGGNSQGGNSQGGNSQGGNNQGGNNHPHPHPHGNPNTPGYCHKPAGCQSGITSSKCYLFKMDDGHYFGYNSKKGHYTSEPDSANHHMGKFRFCRDSNCTAGCAIDPGYGVKIRDLHGDPNKGTGANQWVGGQKDGDHIKKEPNYSAAGEFTITKWTCGKYCLGGFHSGVGPTCPSDAPAITFTTLDPQSCVPVELVEVPCDIRSTKNNCRWQKEPGSCGTGDPRHCKCGYDI